MAMREIYEYDLLPSTSEVAREAAQQGAKHLYTVVARAQSAGRGRAERRFFSPAGGLYMSTVLRTAPGVGIPTAITPFAALAVHRAILRVCGVQTQIKWVNDLLLDSKKVCGILAASGKDAGGMPFVILGIGVNIGKTAFPPELQAIATALPYCDRLALCEAILDELASFEEALASGNWLADYRAHSAVLGREVDLHEDGCVRRVHALDICANGALLVQDGEKTRTVHGGEVTLRLAT